MEVDDELLTEKPEQVESSEAGTREEPTTHSSEISSSVAASFLPSPQLPVSCDISDTKPSTFWRPWEDLHKDKTVDGDDVISQKSLVTPPKPYFSPHLKTSPRDWSPSSTAIHHHPPQVSRSQRNHHWSLWTGEVTLVHGGWIWARGLTWVAESLRMICPLLGYHKGTGVTWKTTVTRLPTLTVSILSPVLLVAIPRFGVFTVMKTVCEKNYWYT